MVSATKWSNMCSRQTALITLSSFSIPPSIAQQIQSKTQVIDPSETHVCFHVLLTMLWASFRDNVYLCFPSVYHIAALKPYSKADLPLENQAFRSCSIWDLFFLFFSSYAIDCSPTEIQILSRCLLGGHDQMQLQPSCRWSSITSLSNLFHCPAAINMSG